MANDLVAVPAVYLAEWMNALRGVRTKLVPQLSAIYCDAGRRDLERSLATDVLADYAADDPSVLASLLMDADPTQGQFAVIYPKFKTQSDRGLPALLAVVGQALSPDTTDAANETLAKRQANAAVVLLRLRQPDRVWPLLKHPAHPQAEAFGFSDPRRGAT